MKLSDIIQMQQDRSNGVVLSQISIDKLIGHALMREIQKDEQTELAERLRQQAETMEEELQIVPPKCDDAIVEMNVALLRSRSDVGVRKYGTTLADNKLPLRAWLAHALEETLDNANYLQAAMQEINAAPQHAAPSVTVDTTEFGELAMDYRGAVMMINHNAPQAAYERLVAHIDAHTAAVAEKAAEDAIDQHHDAFEKMHLRAIEAERALQDSAPQQHAQAALSEEVMRLKVHAEHSAFRRDVMYLIDRADVLKLLDASQQPAAAPQTDAGIPAAPDVQEQANPHASTFPEKIWLNVGDGDAHEVGPYKDLSELSWCWESISRYDVAYVRADLSALTKG